MRDLLKEMSCGAKCIKLVKELLAEAKIELEQCKENGCSTNEIESKIARMKCALGGCIEEI